MNHYIFCDFHLTKKSLHVYDHIHVIGNGILYDSITKKIFSYYVESLYIKMMKNNGYYYDENELMMVNNSTLITIIKNRKILPGRCHIVNNTQELYSVLDILMNLPPKPKFEFVDLSIEI